MPKLKIQNFGGEVPRQSDTMLKDADATTANNVRLYSGELRAWNGPKFEFLPVIENVSTIYRFINPSNQDFIWLTWAADVDVERSALDDTTDFRLYYTGDGTPKKTNWAMAGDDTLSGQFPGAFLNMGVPGPTDAPTLAAVASGSALSTEDRFYVYTNVSTFGSITEESAPSPVSAVVTVTAGQKVTVTGFTAVPTLGYNITARRIYRTLPGEDTSGSFVFVAEIPLATTTYTDDLLVTQLGEPLETNTWLPPPADLKGLVSMANGMMAGFVGNTVYFCEPYFHHTWPINYAQSVSDTIVGLGSYGNTLIVMTTGQPYAMVGVSPDQISIEKISMPEPCISKKSIASDAYGVLYASPNGIVAIGPNARQVITNELFRRNEWQEYAPSTIAGAIYDGKYFGSIQSSIHGVTTMVISRDDYPALSFLQFRATAFFDDLQSGTLYYVEPTTNTIYQLDGDAVNPILYEWQSKRFVFEQALTWSVIRVDVDVLQIDDNAQYLALVAEITAANSLIGEDFGDYNEVPYNTFAYNASLFQEVPPPGASVSATVTLLGEKDVVKCALTVENYSTLRIPSFKSREIKIKLNGNVNIRSVALATSFQEMRDNS